MSTTKRILVICLQSSGCSLFMKLLGQHNRTASIVDVYIKVPSSMMPAPESFASNDVDFVAMKVTIHGDEVGAPVARLRHIEKRFRPAKKILFLRDPVVNYEHLLQHVFCTRVDTTCDWKGPAVCGYGNRCGSPLGKLRALETLYTTAKFDAILRYADLVDHHRWGNLMSSMRRLGFPLERDHFEMHRGNKVVRSFAKQALGATKLLFDLGHVSDSPIRDQVEIPNASNQSLILQQVCPRVLRDYNSTLRLHSKSRSL